MTTDIKPIETRYAGCRFRSRLEARWAVFFDFLTVKWQYEPQGYTVDGEGYLPDFWLPDLGIWAEVKGTLDGATLSRLVRATSPRSGLPANPNSGGAPDPRHGPRILLLGPIPEPGLAWTHTCLEQWKGDTSAQRIFFEPYGDSDYLDCAIDAATVITGHGAPELDDNYAAHLLEAEDRVCINLDSQVTEAYRLARSARFEHGEVG